MDDINKRIILARKLLQITLDPSVIDDVVDVSLGRKPWCLVEGLEAAEDERKQPKRAIIAGLGILGLMNLRPTGYKYEHDGKLVHDIMPLAGNDDLAASTGRAFLPFHSDMAFLRFPRETSHDFKAAAPDFLVLAGVLNEPKIPTEIIVLKDLLEHMDGDLVAELRKSQFNIASPATVTPPRTAERVPILYDHADYGEMIRYNGRPGVITGTDEQAEQCVARLGDAISNAIAKRSTCNRARRWSSTTGRSSTDAARSRRKQATHRRGGAISSASTASASIRTAFR